MISKPGFEQQKKVFSPFLRNDWVNRTEYFLQVLTINWGTCFISPQNLVSIRFGSPYKSPMLKIILVFDKILGILLFPTHECGIFQTKKHAPHLVPSCH